jgi:predicted metal-dependent hydrolase
VGIDILGRLGSRQLELGLAPKGPDPAAADGQWLLLPGRRVLLRLVRHRRARRYVLRLSPDGAARVTIPRGGTAAEARQFALRNAAWIERQLLRQAARPTWPKAWMAGSEILFRGEPVSIEVGVNGESNLVRLGGQELRVADASGDLRPALETRLRRLAEQEFPPRVFELAARQGIPVRRVSVRNQRSRWGSCSRRGTISLNWRLIQTPESVRDYIILHELAHVREMNHSSRFWEEVARLCPGFEEAERWLKAHADLLR